MRDDAFVLLALGLAAIAVAWLTRPLWRSPGVAAALAAFVFVLTAFGYSLLGTVQGVSVAPGAGVPTAASAPSMEQITEIVDRAPRPIEEPALALAGALAFDKGDYADLCGIGRRWRRSSQ